MKIVFTNGCFDILHRGHLELLKFCKTLGDQVIVGLNSDNSVRLFKGEDRPIFKQSDRKALLEEMKCVDKVIIFEEETPYNLIKSINPDIIVKGGDYTIDDVVGKDLATVVIFETVDEYSTTKITQNISNR